MQKRKVIVDTNVLVSAAIGSGYALLILQLFIRERPFDIAYSEEILAEYFRVAAYGRIAKKYPSFKVDMEALISKLQAVGITYEVTERIADLTDPSDNKFLDLAYACKADYLITGNHLDFTITEFYQTKIVSPKIFWELYETNGL